MQDRHARSRWMAAGALVVSLLLLSGVVLNLLNTRTELPNPVFRPRPPFTPIRGAIPHPTGKQDIVVQYNMVGFMYTGLITKAFPYFTLYGDGTAVYSSQTGYHEIHLDAAAMQRLLSMILNEKRFFELDFDLQPAHGLGTDLATTTVRVVAAGQDYTVAAYGLRFATAGIETPERQRLSDVAGAIRNLMMDNAPLYQPAAAILYLSYDTVPLPGRITATPDPAVPAWPVPGVRLADATSTHEIPTPHLLLTGATAVAALQVANRSHPFTQEGQPYTVVVVPELP